MFEVGTRFALCRPDETVSTDRLVIRLHPPGNVFGQGWHSSTRAMLEELQAIDLSGASVADIGCGTGVLALAAAALGAAEVSAWDIDEDALALAARNADLNAAAMTVHRGDGPDLGADVVLCNTGLLEVASHAAVATRRIGVVTLPTENLSFFREMLETLRDLRSVTDFDLPSGVSLVRFERGD